MPRKPSKKPNIYKRGNKFYIRFRNHLGQDKRLSAGFTQAQAEAFLKKQLELDQRRKLGLAPSEREEERAKLTVSGLIERYRAKYEAKKGATAYKGYMKRWKRTLGGWLAKEVVPGDIEDWQHDMLAQGMTNATINRHTSFLRALYNLAIRDRLLDFNPVAKGRIKKLQENGPRDRVISRTEERLILPELAPVDRAAFIVCLYSGIRQAEMLRIERDDVDFKNKTIKLRDTKAGKDQTIHMNSAVEEALAWRCSEHGHDLLFRSEANVRVPMSGSRLTERLKEVCKKLGLKPGILWHSTRHTYVTRLDEMGVSIGHTKELARHSTTKVTERYMHSSREAIREASENLAQEFAGPLFPESPASRGHLRAL